MASLTDIITYRQKWFSELTSIEHREQVADLARKLEPLKHQISNHRKAQIDITDDAGIATYNLPEEIASEIRLKVKDEA